MLLEPDSCSLRSALKRAATPLRLPARRRLFDVFASAERVIHHLARSLRHLIGDLVPGNILVPGNPLHGELRIWALLFELLGEFAELEASCLAGGGGSD